MCPTRIEPKLSSIELDLSAAFFFERGLGRAELLEFGPRLEDARRRLSETVSESVSGDSGCCVTAPQRLLDDYHQHRQRSLLGQILATAKRLRDVVDRVVILGSPPLTTAAQLLFAACCHPYHNDLLRGQRGGRPRIYVVPAEPENDLLQGLLDLLPQGRLLHTVDDRWGLLAIDGGGCNQLVTGLFGVFWDAMQTTVQPNEEGQYAVAVGSSDSSVMALAEQAGCQRVLIDDKSSAWVSDCFNPGVLLAASVMGMDIVKLLRGAAAMIQRFISTPPGDNPALDFAGLCHLLRHRRGIAQRVCSADVAALRPLEKWISRDGYSAEAFLIQLLVQPARRDRLRVTMPAMESGTNPHKRVARFLSELTAEQAAAIRAARTAAGQPTAVIRLPELEESTVGQLIHMLSITAGVERILSEAEDSSPR